MRRWIPTISALLAAMALVGVLFSVLTPPKPSGLSSQTAAIGLVLLEEDEGLYVLAVMDGSRASSAGIQPGDRLTAARGTSLHTVAQLEALLTDSLAEGALLLTVQRYEETLTAQLPAP